MSGKSGEGSPGRGNSQGRGLKGSNQAKCGGSGWVDALSVTKALLHGETVLKRMQRGGGRGTGWQVWGAGPRSEVDRKSVV